MPDEALLAAMYGPEYKDVHEYGEGILDPKEPQRVANFLRTQPRGVFLDYGCGPGSLLREVAKLGWRPVGIEYEEKVAREAAERTGATVVVASRQEGLGPAVADVLHLGDVLEHLTDLDRQMPAILRLLKPGGVLIAQGPLENNANLFTAVLRLARRLRPRARTEMAPYHVMLATARGQLILFERFGLETIEYRLKEVSWPAPSRLSWGMLRSPRAWGLYALRRCSQVLSACRPRRWGNRYFYVGRRLA
jgi:SAM-dependent methyltransferase